MLPHYSNKIHHWLLDRNTVYLNHGSFGACPAKVLEKQTFFREQLEKQPMKFLLYDLPDLLENAKQLLAKFTGCNSHDMVFVKNATEGVNTVLNSLYWGESDRVLITNQIYPACRNAVYYHSHRFGYQVDEVILPYPFAHEDEVIRPVLKAIKPDTRLVILDHIASPTGFVYPVKKISQAISDTQTEILVDGAHAPGAIPLNIEELGVHFYTGNCHKWMCSPKGAAFLWAHPEFQFNLVPLNFSMINVKGNEFQDRFYWTGTYDPTPFLCIPEAIETLQEISETDYSDIINHNNELNQRAAQLICEEINIPLPCPAHMLACMTSFPLPDLSNSIAPGEPDPLQQQLANEYQIEVPVFRLPDSGQRLLRFSCHLYNSLEQYEYLADALKRIKTG